MQSFIMNSHEVFIHIHQGCFAGTGAIVRLPQCQWSKPDGYGKISQCITTTKHSKAKTMYIFLGIYCTGADDTTSVMDETRLLQDLLDPVRYDKRALPRYNRTSNVAVEVGISAQHLLELVSTCGMKYRSVNKTVTGCVGRRRNDNFAHTGTVLI